MNKILIIIFIVVLISLNLISCKNSDKNENIKDSSLVEIHPKGSIPFDFPVSNTSSESGEYVLAPSLEFINSAWEKNGENSMFIFYSRKMIKSGELESELDEIGKKVVIPNSLIISIPANQEVKNGDIVLTWWQSGSGMSRAIVIDDKIPTEPVVSYLDLEWDYYGDLQEKLLPNSFVKISDVWQPGCVVAYKDDFYMNRVQIVKVVDNKVLTIGWAGKIAVINKADCKPIPINLDLSIGDKVQVPFIGSFTEGVVKKYDKKFGRAWVEIDFSGSKKEIVVAIGDIAKDLILN